MIVWLCLALLLFLPTPVVAKYDPRTVPNNIYGIHLADTNDIVDVPALVNAHGDWGYVTLILADADRDPGRWNNIFNQLRRLHLIPIIRIATHIEGSAWAKPTKEHVENAAKFLNQLNWPTENRYVALYNEPNHANEWGGVLDPEGYADILDTGIQAFHKASEDFYVLPAGLDVSASNVAGDMDAASYLSRMIRARPSILQGIDGWNSHSYPNPAFSGSPNAYGRGTVRSYDWELSYLKALGLTRDLPVFITETGWVHSGGKVTNNRLLSPETVAEYIKTVATGAWTDPRIVAVTPFLLNYQDVPFDHFSMRKIGSSEYYAHYFAYQGLTKTTGQPQQREKYTLAAPFLPAKLVAGSVYTLKATIKNEGQAILSQQNGYEIAVGEGDGFSLLGEPVPTLEPGEQGEITVHLKTPNDPKKYTLSIVITHNKKQIPLELRELEVIPPPSLKLRAQLGWRNTSDADQVTVLVYKQDTLIHKYTKLSLQKGILTVKQLTNVVPGEQYRVVMLVPYYLPRQNISVFKEGTTTVELKRFYPLDFDRDGTFTMHDILAAFQQKPHDVWSRLVSP